jgi:hypothetical protein
LSGGAIRISRVVIRFSRGAILLSLRAIRFAGAVMGFSRALIRFVGVPFFFPRRHPLVAALVVRFARVEIRFSRGDHCPIAE